jgi:PPOX class probable F420-dependent enzyme
VAELTEKQQQFLEEPFVGVATTLRPDGSPHSTVVWVDIEDGIPSFNTAYGRVKPNNLQHDPRASLIVVDPNDTYRWLSVDGRAELTTDGADDQIDKLARKYTEHETYPWRVEGQQRVTVRIHPEHVTATGLE